MSFRITNEEYVRERTKLIPQAEDFCNRQLGVTGPEKPPPPVESAVLADDGQSVGVAADGVAH